MIEYQHTRLVYVSSLINFFIIAFQSLANDTQAGSVWQSIQPLYKQQEYSSVTDINAGMS